MGLNIADNLSDNSDPASGEPCELLPDRALSADIPQFYVRIAEEYGGSVKLDRVVPRFVLGASDNNEIVLRVPDGSNLLQQQQRRSALLQ